jgi:hypothetical protein
MGGVAGVGGGEEFPVRSCEDVDRDVELHVRLRAAHAVD